jgi:hypothetical protein
VIFLEAQFIRVFEETSPKKSLNEKQSFVTQTWDADPQSLARLFQLKVKSCYFKVRSFSLAMIFKVPGGDIGSGFLDSLEDNEERI